VFANAFWNALLGGMLIGAGVAVLLLCNGRVAGISGILGSTLHADVGAQGWRLAFLLGLVVPAAVVGVGTPVLAGGLGWLAVSGALVGVGTQLGSGCTSGHGVCGMANLSLRSFVATVVFMVTAAVTVFIVRHVWGGA
jgi:uncharacterized membrane protein YedE/YeeE